MSGDIYRKALVSADRCIPTGAPDRGIRVSVYIQGYMAGHAAMVRRANKIIFAERAKRATGNG